MEKRSRSFLIPVLIMMILCTMHPGIAYGQQKHEYKILKVPLFAQQTRLWCWAAVGEMIMAYFGKNIPQCIQVNREFSRQDCCYNYDSCRKIEMAVRPGFDKYGIPSYKFTTKALEWDKLKCQIDHKKPIGYSYHLEGKGVHYVVIIGYIAINDSRLLMVNDPYPWNCCDKYKGGEVRLITYSEYVGAQDHRYHCWSDFDHSINTN